MKPADQVRAYTFSFPITHFATNEIVVRFVPQEAGRLTLSLLGPYERVAGDKDAVYQEEVLWDQIDVAGAVIVPESAALLRLPVRSWLRQRYDLGLIVQARVPVTLRCLARSAVPADFRESPPLVGADSPAHRAAARLQRGVSLAQAGDFLRRGTAAALFTDEDFASIRREGFDHVRLPVAWHLQTGSAPSFTLSPELFARIDLLVAKAAKQELTVVLGCQEFDGLFQNPAVELPRFLAIWRQVAAHYNDFPAQVAFELISPAGNHGVTPALNGAYGEALRVVRSVSPQHPVLVSPGRMGNAAELSRLELPQGDNNLLVSVYSRDPEPFTQQPANGPLSGIRFPGPPDSPGAVDLAAVADVNAREWLARYQVLPADRNPSGVQAIRGLVQFARQWSAHTGRPVYFADVGCSQAIEAGSRARYYAAWREALAEAGLGWGIADWKQVCRYWDEKSGQPMVGLREALFPGRAPTPPIQETVEPLRNAMKEIHDLRREVQRTGQQSAVEIQALRVRATEMQEQSSRTQQLTRLLTAGVLVLAIAVIILVAFRNRAPAESLLPVPAGLAAPVPSDVREGTMAHVARLMMDKLVQKLLHDRREHLDVQEHAAQELAEMERRLERLQAPLQDRMMIYEKRVAELEKDLAKKGEENRELIRAKIALTKEKLAAAQSAVPSDWRAAVTMENFGVRE